MIYYLSGFFIFLAFVANKRTLNRVKGAWELRFYPAKGSANTTSITDKHRTDAKNVDEQQVTTAL